MRETSFEDAHNVASPSVPNYVERRPELVWCEIDNEAHLRRAQEEFSRERAHERSYSMADFVHRSSSRKFQSFFGVRQSSP